MWAAILCQLLVQIYSFMLPTHPKDVLPHHEREGFRIIALILCGGLFLAAGLICIVRPSSVSLAEATDVQPAHQNYIQRDLNQVLGRATVWLHVLIIISFYTGLLAVGYFTQFGHDAYGMEDIAAAQLTTLVNIVRPFSSLLAGFLADRWGSSSQLGCALFSVLVCAFLHICTTPVHPSRQGVLLGQVSIASFSVFGLQAICFSYLQEARLPNEITGAAVGFLSVLGYTPDVFVGPLAGYFLDRYSGARGHQLFMACVAGIGSVGFLASFAFTLLVRNRAKTGFEAVRKELSVESD